MKTIKRNLLNETASSVNGQAWASHPGYWHVYLIHQAGPLHLFHHLPLIGFIMTQVGMYMGNRWGRSPRPDEKIDSGLKDCIVNLHSIIIHPLYAFAGSTFRRLGPSAVHHQGKIAFEKPLENERRRIFAGLYAYLSVRKVLDVRIDAENEMQALRRFFAKNMEGSNIPRSNPFWFLPNNAVELKPAICPSQP